MLGETLHFKVRAYVAMFGYVSTRPRLFVTHNTPRYTTPDGPTPPACVLGGGGLLLCHRVRSRVESGGFALLRRRRRRSDCACIGAGRVAHVRSDLGEAGDSPAHGPRPVGGHGSVVLHATFLSY